MRPAAWAVRICMRTHVVPARAPGAGLWHRPQAGAVNGEERA